MPDPPLESKANAIWGIGLKRRFIISISLFFIAAFSILSFLLFHYLNQERLRLIDQQIESTMSVLASSNLSEAALSDLEKTEDIIFENMDDVPPNQIILLRRLDGSVIYKNDVAKEIGITLPITKDMELLEIQGNRVRWLTYKPAGKPIYIQVGLVLDQRNIYWKDIIWRISILALLVMAIFVTLATFLTSYLLRPVKELALYFRYQTIDTEAKYVPPRIVADSPEFMLLSEAVEMVTLRWKESLVQTTSVMARLMHEIRTPLTVLRNRLESLKAGPSSGGKKLDEALEEMDHIEALSHDFMTWTKLEYSLADDLGLHAIAFLDFISKLACVHQEGVELSAEVDASYKVFAKQEHLRIILENLLENARRHGIAGKKITLAVDRDGFEVRNFGDRPPERVIQNLGKPFNRGEGSGTGLGLANVVSLAKKYGWNVIYRRDGEVNVFRIDFPPRPIEVSLN
jgi:signal transduction histidine kinase